MVSPYADLERPPLRVDTLTRALVHPGSMWRAVRVLDEAESTNAVLAAEAAEPEGLVVVAEHQTAGRGRLDRTWVSPPRAGLTFSVLLKPARRPQRWGWLPLLTGLAVAEAMAQVTELDVAVKWPNDILVRDRKTGGVLVERHGAAAVVGVGVNVTTRMHELPDHRAISLQLAGAVVTDRETLLRAMLRAIEARYTSWCASDDTTDVHAAYVARCATLGRQVEVELPDGANLRGRAERVDEDGHLMVAAGDAEHALSAGDVVHVRPQ
jgi:BirA family biotin operon repressor/biotin-[acetyl-CoA-carboxylase] ligase